jgi:hypothetical protein
MLAIIVSINVLWIFLIAVVSAMTGFFVRGDQSKKRDKQVLSLENEMLKSHEEILKLQKEIVKLEKMNNPPYKSRVVPMKDY